MKARLPAVADAGPVPVPFFEGDHTFRLKILAELPPAFCSPVPPEKVKEYVKSLVDMFAGTNGRIVDGVVESIPAEPCSIFLIISY